MKRLILLVFLTIPAASDAIERFVYRTRVQFDENSCSYAGHEYTIKVRLERANGKAYIRGGELMFRTDIARRRELTETFPGLHEVAFQEYTSVHHIQVQNVGKRRINISHSWGSPGGQCAYRFDGVGRLIKKVGR